MSAIDQNEWSRILNRYHQPMANPRQHYELFGQPEPESGDPNTIFNGKSEVQIARGVVRKTSIKVSSEPLETENVGSSSSYAFAIVGGPPKNPIRKRIVKYRGKNGGGKRDSSSESSSHLRQDLKGLERAADLKRWAGMGKPGEAWGKLKKVRPQYVIRLLEARLKEFSFTRILNYGTHKETLWFTLAVSDQSPRFESTLAFCGILNL